MSEPSVTVVAAVKGKEHRYQTRPGANLLTSALRHKVPVDNICRVGLCGTCQVCLLEGADSVNPPTEEESLLLDSVPLREGVRLSCQVEVVGDVVISQPEKGCSPL